MTTESGNGVRARARAQLLADARRVARTHLAEGGAPGLSVRAIARELGLASSALYRYFPSRDALLTELIIEAYNALGDAVEAADAAIDRDDLAGRYRAIAHAIRDWARANPHEYALIYGSPVPGYAAPDDTIDPAIRAVQTLIRFAEEIEPTDALRRSATARSATLTAQLEATNATTGTSVDLDVLALGAGLWAQLFGMVSFELFGTFTNAFDPADDLFAHQVELAIAAFGIDTPTA